MKIFFFQNLMQNSFMSNQQKMEWVVLNGGGWGWGGSMKEGKLCIISLLKWKNVVY